MNASDYVYPEHLPVGASTTARALRACQVSDVQSRLQRDACTALLCSGWPTHAAFAAAEYALDAGYDVEETVAIVERFKTFFEKCSAWEDTK